MSPRKTRSADDSSALVISPSKTLQADRVRDFYFMQMRKNQRITSRFNDGDRLRGILLEEVALHQNSSVNVDAQVLPLS